MLGNSDFFEKLYTFLKNKLVLFNICQALDIFVKLKGSMKLETIRDIEEVFK
jgi:hypothetical protein